MANEKLIRASDARRAILKEDPKLAYCIDEIPGVDAVPVVRCKDCKYYNERNEDCDHPALWVEYCSDFGLDMKPDDFCSYGERREGE